MTQSASAPPYAAVAAFNEVLATQRRGDLVRAETLCERLSLQYPAFVDVWHLRGLLAFQRAQYQSGIPFVERSLALNPLQPAALGNLGSALLMLKRPAEALATFDAAIRLQGGSVAGFLGRGNALLELGRHSEALTEMQRALELQPDFTLALVGQANALRQLGRQEEALACIDQALQAAPDDFDALLTRGNLLRDLRRNEEALAAYDRCILKRPDHEELLNNRGNALRDLHRHQEALICYDRALAIKPELAETLANRGAVMLDLNRLDEALHCFDQALRVRPDFPMALDSQGLTLLYADRPADAVLSYARLAAIAPAYPLATSNLAFTRALCCDWSQYDRDCAAVIDSVTRGERVQPLPLLSISQSPALQLECARRFMETSFGPVRDATWKTHNYGHDRLRIAYVSADLRQHPVAYLMTGIFERHDRKRFETIAIALQPEDLGATGQRLRKAFDRFIDVTHRSDREAAQLMRDMEIDIAVDLTGLTRWGRPGIFVQRAAPVQVNYLGYAGTMGSSAFDYLLADKVVIPAAQQRWYTEQIVHLPHSYLPNDGGREIVLPASREAAGLPENAFVFCAFTAAYKINPAIFDVWMRLLSQVSDSVLWLRSMGSEVRGNLRREAKNRGISPERLIFAVHIPDMADHLSRQSLADLYVDTVPYNAHSTACDALWAGVPVLTCAGGSFASRGAASALTALGLPELIAQSLEEYEARALELALLPGFLHSLRSRLEQNRRVAPLFDTERTCRDLEAAYLVMQRRAARGAAPLGFAVAACPR